MTTFEVTQGEVPVLTIHGRLDVESAPVFEEHLKQFLEDGRQRLVVDCCELEYISSPGVRVLLLAAKYIDQADGRMAIVSPRGYAKEILRISGIPAVIPMLETRREAMSLMNG